MKKLPVQNMSVNKRARPVLMNQNQTFQSTLSKRKLTFLCPELLISLVPSVERMDAEGCQGPGKASGWQRSILCGPWAPLPHTPS